MAETMSEPEADSTASKYAKPGTFLRWLESTSSRTFALYPVLIIAFETLLHGGRSNFVPWGLPLLVWGYLQYRLGGNFRTRRGGGGPGIVVPPDHSVDSGIYAYTRNPMYLGHLIFMLGLAVTFWSWLALALFAGHVIWFHRRVLHDEAGLRARFGAQYADYQARVKRWI